MAVGGGAEPGAPPRLRKQRVQARAANVKQAEKMAMLGGEDETDLRTFSTTWTFLTVLINTIVHLVVCPLMLPFSKHWETVWGFLNVLTEDVVFLT